jgi:hypothetical protein
MAMIYQASAGVANATKLTISMWCRAHTTNAASEFGDYYRLLEFGNPSGAEGETNCYVDMLTNCDGSNAAIYNTIDCRFGGVKQSARGRDICTFSGSTENCTVVSSFGETYAGNPGQTIAAVAPDGSSIGDPYFTPYVNAGALKGQITSEIDPEKWFHLMVAIDATNPSAKDLPGVKLYVAVNGFARRLGGPETGTSHPTLGTMTPQIRCEDTGYSQQVQANLDVRSGPVTFSGLDVSGSVIVPGFDIDLNGFEIGIPSQRASPNKNTQLLDMAYVQIWVDKFIDPTNDTNFSKLVNVVNGIGSPVNTDIAADYFGPQTYLFKGVRDDFIVNQGTGGAFSSTGTITGTSGVQY